MKGFRRLLTGEIKFEQDVQSGVHAYSFGRFRLDLSRAELSRDALHIPLRPKSFDVLHCLVSRAGELLSREVLLESVWPDLVVTDDSLTQCLIEIRKALGDEKKTIIVTVPRRGYRFEAAVETHVESQVDENGQREQPVNTRDGVSPTTSRAPSGWTLGALLVLAVAIAVTWWRAGSDQAEDVPVPVAWNPPESSIAVLPFTDMSEAGDQAFLGDGIAEEILNLLAQYQELVVIARTSSFTFKDVSADIKTIAQQLNVAYVLEGSVRKAGEEIRVTAQLVGGETGAHVWSKTYDDPFHDIFATQDRIARDVAEILQVELAGDVDQSDVNDKYSPDPQAWEEYIQGRLFYSRRSTGDILRAQGRFEQALEIDPDFADAWVSLAATINLRHAGVSLTDDALLSADTAHPMIREALERAIELDPKNPEALWRMAFFTWMEGNPDRTIELFERAMALGQNNALVQAMMGGFAFEYGQPELSLPFMKRALLLDPVNASTRYNMGAFLYAAGRLEEAEIAFRQTMEIRLGHEDALAWLIWIKIHQAEFDSAEAFAQQLSPGPEKYQAQAMLAQLRGRQEDADAALERLLALPPEAAAEHLAFVYAFRGNIDEAFRWCWRATDFVVNSRRSYALWNKILLMRISPFLSPLHDDERWTAWVSERGPRQQNSVDLQVIESMRSHLQNHPGLYETNQ